jgi:hypothetical protein
LEPGCHPAGLGAKTPNGCLSLPQVIKETTQLRVQTLSILSHNPLTTLYVPVCVSVCTKRILLQMGTFIYFHFLSLVSVSLHKTLIFSLIGRSLPSLLLPPPPPPPPL